MNNKSAPVAKQSKGNPASSFVRVRPYTGEEATVCPNGYEVPREIIVWDESAGNVVLLDPINDFEPRVNGTFPFDTASVLWEFKDENGETTHKLSDQKTVYERAVAPHISQIVEGYDTAFCVAGSTGSGRYHTFYGPNIDGPDRGILPRFAEDIYGAFSKQAPDNSTLRVDVQVIDIDGETYADLLTLRKAKSSAAAAPPAEELKVSATPDGPVLSGSTSAEANTPADFRALLKQISRLARKRDCAHSVSLRFTESFEFEDPSNPGQSITKSRKVHVLFALLRNMPAAFQRCIDVAVEHDTRRNPLAKVPTRDTAFTKLYPSLLQQGYNLCFINCVSPYYEDAREDYNTLQFAQKVSKLIGKPKLHQDEKLLEMRKLADEVKDLKTVVRKQNETMNVVQQELNAREVELMKQEAAHNDVVRQMKETEEEIRALQTAKSEEVKQLRAEKKVLDGELQEKRKEVLNTKMARSDKEAARAKLEQSVKDAERAKVQAEKDIAKCQRETAELRTKERQHAEEEKEVKDMETFNTGTPEERRTTIIRESNAHAAEDAEIRRIAKEKEALQQSDKTEETLKSMDAAYQDAVKHEEPIHEKEKLLKEIQQLEKEIEEAERETQKLQAEIDQKKSECCVIM